MAGEGCLHAGLSLDQGLDVGLAVDGLDKGQIPFTLGLEQCGGLHAKFATDRGERIAEHFSLRHTADEMGLHVLRFGVRSVVHIASNIEVEVVLFDDLGLGHEAAVFWQLAFVGEDEVNLLGVLGAELVLVFAFSVFAVGIDEEHLVTQSIGFVLVDDDDTGRDAGAVEQAWGQTDDGLDDVVIDEQLADELFLATPEQHAVGHDGGEIAVGLETSEHVLDEHEIGLLAGLWAPFAEAGRELQRGAAVIL